MRTFRRRPPEERPRAFSPLRGCVPVPLQPIARPRVADRSSRRAARGSCRESLGLLALSMPQSTQLRPQLRRGADYGCTHSGQWHAT
ncbi:hypothetical protein K466DRAFT_589527 [Polyporus arcularius HHB13444]|uniref:Uncharacterized protein n=1 Tax=Polyporus arcularius HHB13444 TaxID=1314778 RepID=A0A5C3P3U9_9APHY|nr:hypothetical protein K466DRAFT_589527 [Polyporus arcularius HHB13444]